MRKVYSSLALIPALSNGQRGSDQTIRELNGHPLLAYTIAAAKMSRVFTTVVVCTDSEYYADIARYYGAEVPKLQVKETNEFKTDYDWVSHSIKTLEKVGLVYDCFSILRPTSPFRLPSTILRAWRQFSTAQGIDSLRAVEMCKQHPGKMWVVRGNRMTPLMPLTSESTPWHNRGIQMLPKVYVQNASLEFAWSRVVFEGNIAGNVVMPFFTNSYEGFDILSEEDWWYAEHILKLKQASLPTIEILPYGDIFSKVEHGVGH